MSSGTRINRSNTNFIIDVFMMVVMMLAAGVGLLIKYMLLPGFKRNIKYGRDVDLAFWGLDRHQWGTVHLIISLFLLGLVLLHIVLHWRQIKCMYRKLVRDRQRRILFGVSLLILCIILALGPLFIHPQVVTAVGHGTGRLHETRRQNDAESETRHPATEQQQMTDEHREHASLSEEIPVYGYMTLTDVAQQYNISAAALARHLGVPVSETGRKLGQLRRQYNFRMSAIRSYIEKKRTSSE